MEEMGIEQDVEPSTPTTRGEGFSCSGCYHVSLPIKVYCKPGFETSETLERRMTLMGYSPSSLLLSAANHVRGFLKP